MSKFNFISPKIKNKLFPKGVIPLEWKTAFKSFRTNLAETINPTVNPSKLLESKWAETKNALMEGSDLTTNKDGSENLNKKQVMETVLENLRIQLVRQTEEAKQSNNVSNVATLNKVLLPVTRRVVPNLFAHDIMSVQAMSGPVGKVHMLRGMKKTTNNHQSFHIINEVVEAKSRKLAARWTFESAQDAQTQQGLDIEAEIMPALAQEIVAEHDCEIISFLKSIATEASLTFDINKELNPEGTLIFVGDIYHKLAKMIDVEASAIATRTKRGPGNWCVVSEKALLALKSSTFSNFNRAYSHDTKSAFSSVRYAGMLNETTKVYCDAYSKEDASILIGYKGTSNFDSPAIFAPYIPLTSSGVVIDPQTFEPVVGFMARYGFMTMAKSDKYISEAKDYFGLVDFKSEDFKSFV